MHVQSYENTARLINLLRISKTHKDAADEFHRLFNAHDMQKMLILIRFVNLVVVGAFKSRGRICSCGIQLARYEVRGNTVAIILDQVAYTHMQLHALAKYDRCNTEVARQHFGIMFE